MLQLNDYTAGIVPRQRPNQACGEAGGEPVAPGEVAGEGAGGARSRDAGTVGALTSTYASGCRAAARTAAAAPEGKDPMRAATRPVRNHKVRSPPCRPDAASTSPGDSADVPTTSIAVTRRK